MFYSTTDGQYINEGQAFTINGIQYSSNWLNLSTPEEKLAIGLEEVIATNSPDNDTYYWVTSTLNKASLTYTNTPKDLAQVKTTAVSQVNATAYSILLPSDWMAVKAFETSTPIDPTWNVWRATITYTNTPKDLTQVKINAVNQVNVTAYSILLPSDWMAVKAFETSTPIDPTWNTWRATIRTEAANAITAINKTTDVDAVATAVQVNWTPDPKTPISK